MTLGNLEAWLIVATTLGAAILTAVLWIKRLPHLSADFMFLFFFTSTVVYLQIAPLIVLLSANPRTTIERFVVPGAGAYLTEYAHIQLAALLLFQLPLLIIYYGRWRSSPPIQTSTLVATRSASLVAAVAVGAPVLFLWVGYRDGLLALHQHSAATLTLRLLAMPPVDFFIYRTYQETATFLTGVTFFVFARTTGTTRRIAALGLLANMVGFGTWGLIVSRSAIVLMAACLIGWWLRVSPIRFRWGRAARRIVAAAVVAGVMVSITLNLRMLGRNEPVSLAVLNPFRVGIFGDQQGYARLNCVDLVARLAREISRDGPAWGEAWRGYTWIVRRFVDPRGFNAFRISMRTTAKSYLMRRYLHLDVVDYYSCSLVDFFGNFSWLGFPLAAIVFGASFRFYRIAMFQPSSGTAVILALFVMTSILYFDQEAGTTLFGWLRKVPLLIAIVAARPFIVRSET